MRHIRFALAILLALAVAAPVTAQSMADHGHHAGGANIQQADGFGQLHSIDSQGGSVNLTHDPIEAIGWPAMRMDLPVTRRVDLGQFQAGDPVRFSIKLGRDQIWRIVSMEKSSADGASGGGAMDHHGHH
jgi:Cu/Ag efflux protein CusF